MKTQHHSHPTLQFVLPVILESLFNTAVGLIFSYLIGGISGSSLTTISLGNQILNMIVAITTMLVTGSSILCARLLGSSDKPGASHILEQTILFTTLISLAITLACLIFATPLMSLLMPNAESGVLSEGIVFFRIFILCLPFTLLNNACNGALRASGDGRSPMTVTGVICACQLVFACVFLRLWKLGVIGAGYSYLFSRIIGTALAFLFVLHSPRYMVNLRNSLKPNFSIFRRILRIGIPTSIESIFVQTGYLTANSMLIGLGTFEAAVYNVVNTLYSFAALPQNIGIAVAMPLIGQLIGAKAYTKAKRTGWGIWAIGMLVSLLLSSLIWFFAPSLTPIYSSDPAVQSKAAKIIFSAFVMCIPAISLNTLDPQLRAGGDVKYVMYVTIIAVWLIRLPLTYLFCYHWSLGAAGVFWSNTISLFFRMVCNMIRFIQGKYLYMRV